MRQPRRLRIETTDDLERELLESWRSGGPSADSKRRALASLGAGMGTGLSLATTSKAASGATAGSVGGSIAPKALTIVLSSTLKWVAAGSIGLASATAAIYHASAPTIAPPPSYAPAAESPPSTTAPEPPAASEPPAPLEPVVTPRSPVASATAVRTAPTRAAASMTASGGLRAEPRNAAVHPSIAEELASLDEAREALRRGDASSALRILEAHDARYSGGALSQEATVVRLQALLRVGDRGGATAVGQRFLQAHPTSPYAGQVRAIMQGAN